MRQGRLLIRTDVRDRSRQPEEEWPLCWNGSGSSSSNWALSGGCCRRFCRRQSQGLWNSPAQMPRPALLGWFAHRSREKRPPPRQHVDRTQAFAFRSVASGSAIEIFSLLYKIAMPKVRCYRIHPTLWCRPMPLTMAGCSNSPGQMDLRVEYPIAAISSRESLSDIALISGMAAITSRSGLPSANRPGFTIAYRAIYKFIAGVISRNTRL